MSRRPPLRRTSDAFSIICLIIQKKRTLIKIVYAELLTSGNLNGYLVDLNEQAEEMFSQLVKELAGKDGITETLKANNQMDWVQRMNAVRETATEIVNNNLIYA